MQRVPTWSWAKVGPGGRGRRGGGQEIKHESGSWSHAGEPPRAKITPLPFAGSPAGWESQQGVCARIATTMCFVLSVLAKLHFPNNSPRGNRVLSSGLTWASKRKLHVCVVYLTTWSQHAWVLGKYLLNKWCWIKPGAGWGHGETMGHILLQLMTHSCQPIVPSLSSTFRGTVTFTSCVKLHTPFAWVSSTQWTFANISPLAFMWEHEHFY